jgi:hypothetical protein
MYCNSCGNKISNNAVICTNCGAATDKFGGSSEVSSGVLTMGYVLAFMMPFIGGMVGIYAMARRKPGHGIGMLTLAIFSFFFWIGFIEAM